MVPCRNVSGYGIAVFAICIGRFQPDTPNAASGIAQAVTIWKANAMVPNSREAASLAVISFVLPYFADKITASVPA